MGSAHISQRSPAAGAGRLRGDPAQQRRRQAAGARAACRLGARARRQLGASWPVRAGTATDSTPSRTSRGNGSRCRPVSVEARAGPPHVVVGAAARAAQQPPPDRLPPSARCSAAPGHGPGAPRAVVAVGEQVLADPAGQHRVPPTRNPPTSPGSSAAISGTVPGRTGRSPGSPAVVRLRRQPSIRTAARPPGSPPAWRPASRVLDDLDGGHLRRGGLDGRPRRPASA